MVKEMTDRCFWCTNVDGNTDVRFAVVDVKDTNKYVLPVFVKYCPFCGRNLKDK